MSVGVLLRGSIEFVDGVDLDTVKNVVHELADDIEIEPTIVVPLKEFVDDYYKNHDRNMIIRDKHNDAEQYTAHYEYVNWSSHIYDDDWKAIENIIVSHAKIIEKLDLSLWYLSGGDREVYLNHEELMEMDVKSIERNLAGDGPDE